MMMEKAEDIRRKIMRAHQRNELAHDIYRTYGFRGQTPSVRITRHSLAAAVYKGIIQGDARWIVEH